MIAPPSLGATPLADGRCRFDVWAPFAREAALIMTAPQARQVPMEPGPAGYYSALLADVPPETRYLYRLSYSDGTFRDRPDPASRYQPEGVHQPSQIMTDDHPWRDAGWRGLPLSRYVIYELHVGTFSRQGTFEGIIPHLDDLADLGVSALELMPVAQFPGARNWGYDGVYPFAVQNSYGGPTGLKRLVEACHRRGLAVVLDVVYNHLGPEGNYLRDFAPYFTDFYRTPWGEALNFDGPGSDHVRSFFAANALMWLEQFHIDALRLDAVHAICDFSARPFLEELARTLHQRAAELDRRFYLIAESALNDTRIIRSRELGGFALDAQWNDDFHHSLHCALTGERSGYYRDFDGLADLACAWREGYVFQGQYSRFRQRGHGNSSRNIPARRLVVCAQNHDQVGNRMLGERIGALVSFEQQKLAAAVVLLSPFIPLIFMGEEYGEPAPFLYFVNHSDSGLVQAVREGRRREFAAFDWDREPPDPQAEDTFLNSRLDHALESRGRHRILRGFYCSLLELRRTLPALAHLSKKSQQVYCDSRRRLLWVRRRRGSESVLLIFNFSDQAGKFAIDPPAGTWRKVLDSADLCWNGPGSAVPQLLGSRTPLDLRLTPHSVILFSQNPASGAAQQAQEGEWE